MGLPLIEFQYLEKVKKFKPGNDLILSEGRYKFETPLIKDVRNPFLEISEGVLTFGYIVNIHVGRFLNPIPDEPHVISDTYSLEHMRNIQGDVRGKIDPNVQNRHLDVMYAGAFPLFRIDDVTSWNELKVTLDGRVRLLIS